MGILQSVATALEMLRLHKLRAFLTMLGVIIGVMSVTIIVMVSSGFQFFMTNQFKNLGAETIMVMYDRWGGGTERNASVDGLKMEDVKYLTDHVSDIDIACPVLQVPSEKIVRQGREVKNPRIYASNETFILLNREEVTEGRLMDADDEKKRANVCIVGEEVRDRLFPDKKAVGQLISFKGITLEVVGILKRVDLMGETNARDILLPLSTAQRKWTGGDKLEMIMTRPKSGGDVTKTMDSIWQALMLKSGNKRIYRVDSNESIGKVFGNIFGVAGAVLAAIAALSLLVGGIGIMNIMLVSVTERTKEIGLRKALGAKRITILTQFVVEAATLSLIGGLIGMALAYGIGTLVTIGTAAMKWPSAEGLPTPFPVVAGIMAALFSAFIGVVFGLYPAIAASKLDPIVALRRE